MKLSLYQIISGFLTFCLSAPLCANIVVYGQKLNQADWKVIASRTTCKIRQLIPLYGVAEFEQKYRDKGLQFNIYIIRVPEQIITAKMTAIPPKWNHVTLLRPMGKVKLQANNQTLTLEHTLSLQVITELEDGMFPTLTYKSWMDKNDDIQVSISPINFRERLPKFLKCVASLPLQPLPVVVKPEPKPKPKPRPKPIKITKIVEDPDPYTIYFGANSATLNLAAKDKLKVLVIKIKKNKKSKHIIVSGYSDDTGNKTQSTTVSKQRALNVQSYLEKLGISAKYIFTRYFGRDHAILSN
ncbi:MAG: OmpA family protein, partial [Thiohalomonadales bacterium]